MTGNVFSIEEFAPFDGPGIRTTVFLKGCPLRCAWCHNPEGQAFTAEYIKKHTGCLSCGACLLHTQKDESGNDRFTHRSATACPLGLLSLCGEEYTVDSLLARLLPLSPILNGAKGGVTFSGGEPLAQPDFLCAMLEALKGQLHTAVQTSGFAEAKTFSRVLSLTDYMLFDLKLMDDKAHKHYCGVSNAPILENFRILASQSVPFSVRVPLIPTVTDTEENLRAIADFVSSLGVRTVELLPYNRLAGAKYTSLLRTYAPTFDESRAVAVREDLFQSYGVAANLM